MRDIFTFPHPVNEKAARVVAGLVAIVAAVALATQAHWLLVVLAIGFVLRVAAGPTLDPFGLLATRVAAPRLGEPRHVSGPPKRFAQAMGAVMTAAGAILALGFGVTAAGTAFLVAILIAATLESVLAFCVGCRIFGLLMRTGVIPEEICAECSDIWSRPGMARTAA
jgi:hypothetical protein